MKTFFLRLLLVCLLMAGVSSTHALTITRIDDGSLASGSIISAADAASAKAAFDYAAGLLMASFDDPIQINFRLKADVTVGLGSSSAPYVGSYSYATVRSKLIAKSRSADDATAVASLPVSDPTSNTAFYVRRAHAKALGLIPSDSTEDGVFSFSPNVSYTFDSSNRAVSGKVDFIGVVFHELMELMGRDVGLSGYINVFDVPNDLFRYTAPGTRGLTNGANIYFSIDGGTTSLQHFNNNAAYGGDPQDWASHQFGPIVQGGPNVAADPWMIGTNDCANAFAYLGTKLDYSLVDHRAMDILGYTVATFRNGSFETNGGFAVASAVGWTFANGGGVVVANDEGVSAGNTAVIFNAASAAATGKLSQTFATVPGQAYTLQFDFAAYGYGQTSTSQLLVDVRDGNSATSGTQMITPGSAMNGSNAYVGNGSTFTVSQNYGSTATYNLTPPFGMFTRYTLNFKAVSSTSTVVFTDQSTGGVDAQDVILDNVRVLASQDASSFESPVTGNYTYTPPVSGTDQPWSFNVSSGVAVNGGGIGVVGSTSGQYAFIQNGGTMSRTVNFPTPGIYELAFKVAARAGYGSPHFRVTVGAQTLFPDYGVPANSSFEWTGTYWTVTTAGDQTLTFTNITSSGDTMVLIDNVDLFARATVPVITSPSVANITGTTVTLGGSVASDSNATITQRGVVYSPTSVSSNPIIGDPGSTTGGTTGDFTVGVSGLVPNTNYSWKAFATNTHGTSYTSVGTFTTAAVPPTVTTLTATSISGSSATLNGSVNPNNSTAVVYVQYGLNTNWPGTAFFVASGLNGLSTTPVSFTAAGLTAHTTYYFRFGAGPNNLSLTWGANGSFVPNTVPDAVSQSGFTLARNTSLPITLGGFDNDSDSLTFALASQPAHGAVTRSGSTATYTPTTNYVGPDSFTFTVSDGYGGISTPGTMSLIVQGPPTVTSPTFTSVTTTSATLGGNATSDGGLTIIDRGIVYSLTSVNSDPIMGGSGVTPKSTTGTTGIFTVPTGTPLLSPGSNYTFKAYAANTQGRSYSSAATFTTPSLPTVTSIAPNTGSTLGGTSVTITGTNFTSPATVTFNGASVSANVVNATSITAISPVGTAGSASVIVSTPIGSSAANSLFTYFAAPTVTAIAPSSGSIAGNTSVTITGTNLNGATAVTIGGTPATSFNVVNATTITAVTPIHVAGTASVLVTTPGGTNTANTLYTYVSSPTVTAIAPNTGTMAGGTSVTITGSNFTGATGVTIGGTAANFSFVNSTTITATTPPSSSVGPASVVVTIPSGSNSANSLFTYFNPVVTADYTSATDLPVPPTDGYTATGKTVNVTLSYAPTTGTNLTIVKNTGLTYIVGTFGNLGQGQLVTRSFGGTTYNFVANYYGGTGNDLVLVWAGTRVMGWGNNNAGQLGDSSFANRNLPVNAQQSGVLSGKTVIAVATGTAHSLALCSDGTLAAWGRNVEGQLGNGTGSDTTTPVLVPQTSGVLLNKTVIAIAAGYLHSVVLCSDGTVATWGYNGSGQLGNNSGASQSTTPVAVNVANGTSALYGKPVVAIASGLNHCLALCADGTVAAWGNNAEGELGDSSVTNRNVPVAVNTSEVLLNKTVIAIASGQYHCLALCSDGTLAAWGANGFGQLGNSGSGISSVPVAVVQSSGVLLNKTVTAITAGGYHCLALCADGTLAAWGYNASGQLGIGSQANMGTPTAVQQASGILVGKPVTSIGAGDAHSLAVCSDGTMATWGRNVESQLGTGNTAQSTSPVAVLTTTLAAGERFTRANSGAYVQHTLSLVAAPANSAPTNIALSANNLNENVAANFTVGTLSTTDADAGDTFTYTLPAGVTDNAAFNILGNVLRITASPDFETKNSYSVTVRTTDQGGLPFDKIFPVTINDVNEAPTISNIADLSINEDGNTGALTFTISDPDAGNVLNVSASSSNTTLVENSSFWFFGGSGTSRTITVYPYPDRSGSTVMSVQVSDGTLTATDTFTLTVNAVNDVPTLTALPLFVSLSEDAATQTVNLTGITAGGEETQTLTVTATSSNTALIPNPTVTYTSPNATGSLVYTPVANASGTAVITVTVDDGQASNNTITRTFTVTVNAVNDVPTLTAFTNPAAINEDAGAQTVNITGISAGGGETQTLTVTAFSTNSALIQIPTVTYTSPNATRVLTYTPVPNASGAAAIVVTINDGQASNNSVTRSFVVTVNPVNDMPVFTKGADQSHPFGTNAAQSITDWATGIDDGDPDVTQAFTFTVTNTLNGLFSVQPSVSPTGVLTYTPSGTAGTATVSVSLTDDATAGGVALTTASQTFTITVAPNAAPVLAVDGAGGLGAFSTLVNFTGTSGATRGEAPNSRLTFYSGNYYGTTDYGGVNNKGTIFKMTPAGAVTTLVDFTGTSGANKGSTPAFGLSLGTDGNFYGVTASGGASDFGTIFKMTPAGVLTTVVEFTGASGSFKGAYPQGGMARTSAGDFYGSTEQGGAGIYFGVIFKLTAGGTYSVLAECNVSTGGIGYNPTGGLVLANDGNLYGATQGGGTSGGTGTIFKVTPSGNVTTLVNLNNIGDVKSQLIQGSDGSLYGTTRLGGADNKGTAYKVTLDGVVTLLAQFTGTAGATKGYSPYSGLTQGVDGDYYGTTWVGGQFDQGTFFKVTTGGVMTTLHEFSGNGNGDPIAPFGPLTLAADGSILGGLSFGGSGSGGAIFKQAFLSAAATGAEGSPATITGTFSDPDGNATVTLSASTGTVTANNAASTWSWSATGADGPATSTVTITATDAASATAVGTFTFTVTNVGPAFDLGSNVNLPIGSGALSSSVPFTDPGTDVWSGTVNYGDGGGNQALTVNQGAKTFALSHTYTTSGTFTVSVTLNDDDGGTATDTYTVTTLLNRAPTDISLSASSLVENVTANSTVGTLSTTDADAGNTFTYTLAPGGTDNASFNILSSALRITASPDFETKSSYSIIVRTTDQDGLFFDKPFTVTITNVNEMPSFTKGGNQAHPFGTTGAQSFPSWATAINDGDSTVTQALTFSITGNTTPGLFTTPPSISSNGTLTYTPNGTAGSSTISVTLTDDSSINGTAALTTAAQTFTITTAAQPQVNIATVNAGDNDAAEGGVNNGTFTFTRTDTAGALVANFQLNAASTSSATTDFTLSGATSFNTSTGAGTITFADTVATVTVTLIALTESPNPAEAAETARLDVVVGSGYAIGSPTNATVTINANSFLVTTTANSGSGSLRQAVLNANAIAGADIITFSDGTGGTVNFTDATADTITLSGGQISLNTDITIAGPGADLLIVQNTAAASATSRVFLVPTGAAKTVRLRGLTMTGGNATNGASGLRIDSSSNATVSIVACAIIGNTTPSSASGILHNSGTLSVVNSTISGNTATASVGGGGMESFGTALTLVNSTLSGNSITGSSSSNAGAIFAGATTTTIRDCTITNNNGVGGFSGVRNFSGTVTVANSIIAGNVNNATLPDVGGAFTSGGGNLIGNKGIATGFTNGTNSDQVGTGAAPINPQLATLANNGGRTQTHALLPASTALNAGLNAQIPADTFDVDGDLNTTEIIDVDQRGPGFTRTIGTVDIGAFEQPAAPEIAVSGNSVNITDGDTTPSLSDFTDFGTASGNVLRSFTIQNIGQATLTLSSVSLSGTHASDFTITTAPAVSVLAGNSTTVQVSFRPSANGLRSATLSFTNNDTDESPFDFSIQGTGSSSATDINLSDTSPAENVTANSTVGTLSTTDPEGGNTFTYTLASGGTDNAAFNILGTALRFTASPDFETKNSYSIRVRSTDQGGLFIEKTFLISIVDVADTPQQIWRAANFAGVVSNTGTAANNADPDGDTYINLLEYAFGTDPNNPASGPGEITYDAGAITLRAQPKLTVTNTATGVNFRANFGRRKDYVTAGLTYTVQFSADMQTWQNSTATPTVLASDAELDAVYVKYPFFLQDGRKAQFYRVEVSVP